MDKPELPEVLNEEAVANALMKGLLFAQETYDQRWTLIDTFYKKYPEKYNFIFKRANPDDTVIFQGSSSEGLVIYDIRDCYTANVLEGLRYFRNFDYDVMAVRNDIVVLHEAFQYSPAFRVHIISQTIKELDEDRVWKKWAEAEFCHHD